MFIGIDLGTSGRKAVLIDKQQQLISQSQQSLTVERPAPLHSEQSPTDWWQALTLAMQELRTLAPEAMSKVQAIGLSGEMHGATLLGHHGQVLRPAILWNDGRSAAQCQTLNSLVPTLSEITGNLAMPGFTAPKLLWVREHEPEIFNQIHKVLLPKDYLRYCITGDYASDMSDSAGTLWMNVAKRCWSEPLLKATGLTVEHMPTLYEGTEITGFVKTELATQWGLPARTPVVAGAGDNAAGAVGSSTVNPEQAILSLGTSGVIFTCSAEYRANTQQGVHSFCHAIPDQWHQMSVILSAASCLDWGVKLLGLATTEAFLSLAEQAKHLTRTLPNTQLAQLLFLPYLSGERTPHNNPDAKGVLFGITHDTSPADIALAIVEGIAFAFAEGKAALNNANVPLQELALIGGGTRSSFLCQLLTDVLGIKTFKYKNSEFGPAFGAARLAMISQPNHSLASVCKPEPIAQTFTPNEQIHQQYQARLAQYQSLYRALTTTF